MNGHTVLDIKSMSEGDRQSFLLLIRTGMIEAILQGYKKLVKDVFKDKQIIPSESVYTIDFKISYTGRDLIKIIKMVETAGDIDGKTTK